MDWYTQAEYPLAFSQLFLAMLGMGATLHPRDLSAVFLAPRGLLAGMGAQLLVMPVLGASVAAWAEFSPGQTIGLILVAAVPGGTLSNVVCYLTGANYALSIALTALSTIGCLVTTPLILQLFAADLLPSAFAMPVAGILFDIGLGLLLPLALGMLVRTRLTPPADQRFTKVCIRLSLVLVFLMVVGSSGSGRIDGASLAFLPPWLVLFSTLGLGISLAVAWLARLARPERMAIGIETTLRNTNLALLLKASLFPAVAGGVDPFSDAVLAVVVLAGGLQATPLFPAVLGFRRGWL